LTMFRILPAYLVGTDVCAGAFVECHRARGFNLLRSILSLATLKWIGLVGQQHALRGGLPSRFGKTNFQKSAESHFASLALKHVTQTPALCAAAADAQIEATAVSMETWLHLRRDFARGQPVELVCHGFPPTICGLGGGFSRSSAILNRPPNPTKFPASICGIIANGSGWA